MIGITIGALVSLDGAPYLVKMSSTLHDYKGRSVSLQCQRQPAAEEVVVLGLGDTIVFAGNELVIDSIRVNADQDNAMADIHATDPFVAQHNLDRWRMEQASFKHHQQLGDLLPAMKKHLGEDQ